MTKQNNGAAGTIESGAMQGVELHGVSADGKSLGLSLGLAELHKSAKGNAVFAHANWTPITLNGADVDNARVVKLYVTLVESPDATAKLRSELRDKAAGKSSADARGGSSKVGALEGALAESQRQIAQQQELILALLAKQSQPAPQPAFDPAAMAAMIASAVKAAMPEPVAQPAPAAKSERRSAKNGAKPAAAVAETVVETPAAE